jgi:hypothetical protein
VSLVGTKALNAGYPIKPLAVSKDTGETVNGICRNDNDPISIQYFNSLPYASRVGVVGMNVDDQNEGEYFETNAIV